ncbi:DNA polymerase III subunit chi [Roseateles sp.]|uniref:DNA polymerase III subunit chi n=1 Tax=Roseateles sp. TaxID=1971397 RepID=UPI003263310A
MPQQVSFYSNAADPLRYACRLVRRALASGKPVGVRVPPALMPQLDKLLWSFDATEFIPHRCWDGTTPPEPGEVLLVDDAVGLPHRGLLLNLAEDLPGDAFAFERVLEVIGCERSAVESGRVRYRAYQQAGATLDHFSAAG